MMEGTWQGGVENRVSNPSPSHGREPPAAFQCRAALTVCSWSSKPASRASQQGQGHICWAGNLCSPRGQPTLSEGQVCDELHSHCGPQLSTEELRKHLNPLGLSMQRSPAPTSSHLTLPFETQLGWASLFLSNCRNLTLQLRKTALLQSYKEMAASPF